MSLKTFRTIPIVEANSNRIAGSFCSTMDAVSADELAALAHLRELTQHAREVKGQLKNANEDERVILERRLEELRIQAGIWQGKRRQATEEKNIRLGHATLPVEDLDARN
ncbi:MAG: hypothetical protein HQL84_18715 [Magnetococcales bacterium]|nr:hypothetical protein [Magnetococcales bacterium]MBF0152054.1 hypothetical protein [Magnetococcales bacterium]MBF0349217.1 hypothetical protein [Magnetococcales bacterium]MBF0630684.1 hypothetical protein [Magnetococcales bacterium]